MASFNRVILVGNVTRDPELRYISSGTAVTELGLAVNDRRKGANGEWIEETTFVDVTLWSRQAEIANEYLTKGAPVLIEGRLKLDTWQSKEGEKRSKLKVIGERMQLLSGRGAGGGGGGPRGGGRGEGSRGGSHADGGDDYSGEPAGAYNDAPPDDIPF